ncbi:MAG: potassium/proton antiporter, partial [Bacteroidales bacterium]|nr:potassium/proton antiporter [Bacteroidales bacterium]
GLKLKHNLRPVLELESGSNDPMAYVLTVTFISLVLQGGEPQWGVAVLTVLMQLTIGALVGYLFGKGVVRVINRINIENNSLYPILVFTACIFLFAFTYYIKGNSYLAVYIGGLVIGNSKFVHKRSTRYFFEGLSWLGQLLMFLTLGLLANPSEMKNAILPGIFVSLVMIFFTRPLSVFISLAPFRWLKFRDKMFISWVGLRGAVPIIFAILCRAQGVPHSETIFNIVFFCTLVSLVLQGTTLPLVARWLKLAEPPEQQNKADNFDIDFPEEIKSATSEIIITADVLHNHGHHIMDLGMPEKTLAIMVKRDNHYFVPTGKTTLHEGDTLMVITDNDEGLQETLTKLGIMEIPKPNDAAEKTETLVNILTTNPIRDLQKNLKNISNPIKNMGADLKSLHNGLKDLKQHSHKHKKNTNNHKP